MLFSLSGCAEKILGSAVFLFLVAAGDDSRFFGVPRIRPSKDAPDGMVWMWFE